MTAPDGGLRALMARWRENAGWEHQDAGNTQWAQALEHCADELEAALAAAERPHEDKGSSAITWVWCPACCFMHDPNTGCVEAAAERPTPEECEWKQNNEWDDTDRWDTSCDESFCFIDGGPAENHIVFCCYCGKRVVPVPYVEPDEEAP